MNESFEMMDIGNMNFLLNSGSFFIFVFMILCFNCIKKLAGLVAKCQAHRKWFRKLGIRVYSKSYAKDLKDELIRLFIESYYDIAMCVVLHNISMNLTDDNGVSLRSVYFTNATDSWITVLNLVFTIAVIITPFWCEIIIKKNEDKLGSNKFRE